MSPEHWQDLAKVIAEEMNSGADSVIVPHGTDTMSYSASAVSFMLSNLTGPVIFVGSQRSSDRPSSDAWRNLRSAAEIVKNSDIGEVVVAMYGTPSDDKVYIHRGTNVRKMHTSRRDAFTSINMPPIASVDDSGIKYYQDYQRKKPGKVKVDTHMEPNVSLLYSYPGIERKHFDFLADNNKGIVIAGTGLGHISENLLGSIKDAISSGVHIVITSQCISGAVNLNVYSSGRRLLDAGVIPVSMLPESAYVKLMWVLGHTTKPEEVSRMMISSLRNEIVERITFDRAGGPHYEL